MWERWNATLPDGNINLVEMTAFGHYASRAVAKFVGERVASAEVVLPEGAEKRREVVGTGKWEIKSRFAQEYEWSVLPFAPRSLVGEVYSTRI